MLRKRADRIRGVAGSLESQKIIVSGAAAGAGPGILRVIAEAGADVLAAADGSPALDIEIRRLGTTAGPITGLAADTTSIEGQSELLASLSGPVDALVVNPDLSAGVAAATAAVDLAAAVTDTMRDRGHPGSVVIVSSLAQSTVVDSAAAYLQSEMELLAARVASNAIRVNMVATGHVAVTRRGKPVSSRATPLGHVSLHPVEVGKAVWFLLNESLSGGITGSTIKVDRGASLLRPEW